MAIFFFLIGLEIKRELLIGELNSLKKAAFPFFGALGGMLGPVILFFVLNKNPETLKGWGIPMATDIAFALAILALLGKRVPLSLKIFMAAFAIIDDIGAVLVIALFYTTSIKWLYLAIGLFLVLFLAFLSFKYLYSKYLLVLIGLVVWYLFLKAGIHPTIAGVLLAFTIPIRQKIDSGTYADQLTEIVHNIKTAADPDSPVLTKKQIEEIDSLEDWTEKLQSPLQHLEHKLHTWVAYIIIPLFALANAGVLLKSNASADVNLIYKLALCLLVGKVVGIPLMTFIGHKLKMIDLPDDISWKQIIGVALVAGIGFTMSIFIANLAFAGNQVLIDSAKIGILIGSLLSGLFGYFVLKISSKTSA